MAIKKEGYYYDAQLVRYVNQFLAIFQGLQVQIGKWNDRDERLIPVDIHYAHMDKVVASIMADNTQNKPLKLPLMSAYMSGLSLNMERAHGVGMERRNSYVEVGGLIPEDIKVIHQRMPIQYDLQMELNIYASNTNQHMQILEQILPLFDPSLNIQTSDGPFDWARLTHVELTDVALNTNFPIGSERRIVQSTITFKMPIYIDTPADVRRDFVEKVFLRVGVAGTSSRDNYEIIADLDAQDIAYDLVATDDDLPFQ